VPGTRPVVIADDTLRWNYTTGLDIAAVMLFAVLYWVDRKRERFGAGVGYAQDPVCRMQVETAHAPAHFERHGRRVYFCSKHCRDRYERGAGRDASPPLPGAYWARPG
jgi:YHS domain-containing protein